MWGLGLTECYKLPGMRDVLLSRISKCLFDICINRLDGLLKILFLSMENTDVLMHFNLERFHGKSSVSNNTVLFFRRG